MKTPRFWNENNLITKILYPVSLVYGYVTQLRVKKGYRYKSSAKVICIGNITAGGVGKTPVAMAVAKKYIDEGKKVVFVTRGYKGKLKDIVVDLDKHSAIETGDEARLLASVADVVIAPQRDKGAKIAETLGAEIIIMDDGFQNPYLYKDESWLVFDGEIGIGNGMIIPSGPLRETLENGEKRADRVVIMGNDKTGLANKTKLDVYMGTLVAEPIDVENKKVMAFAGIGRPQKFYNTLKELGFDVVVTKDFEDHHNYNNDELVELIGMAKEKELTLITTQKDYVKIPSEFRNSIKCLKVRAELSKYN